MAPALGGVVRQGALEQAEVLGVLWPLPPLPRAFLLGKLPQCFSNWKCLWNTWEFMLKCKFSFHSSGAYPRVLHFYRAPGRS